MIVTYDPEKQGRSLSEQELQYLKELKPECTSFSADDPELTDELIKRMKESGCVKNRSSILKPVG